MRLHVLLIGISLLLAGCETVPEEKAKLAHSGSQYDLCYNASDNRVLAAARKQASAELIKEKGIQCDWAAFGMLHAVENQQNLSGLATGIAIMQAGRPQPVASLPAQRPITCGQTIYNSHMADIECR
jgi:hypothetical protein